MQTLCTSHLNPTATATPGMAGAKWEQSPHIHQLCVSLGDGVNTHFHFLIAWFWDGSKSSGGGSEQTTSSRLKIRRTSLWGGGFTFNLSVVAFSCCLVIWTFDINCLHSSCSHFDWCIITEIYGSESITKRHCHTFVFGNWNKQEDLPIDPLSFLQVKFLKKLVSMCLLFMVNCHRRQFNKWKAEEKISKETCFPSSLLASVLLSIHAILTSLQCTSTIGISRLLMRVAKNTAGLGVAQIWHHITSTRR